MHLELLAAAPHLPFAVHKCACAQGPDSDGVGSIGPKAAARAGNAERGRANRQVGEAPVTVAASWRAGSRFGRCRGGFLGEQTDFPNTLLGDSEALSPINVSSWKGGFKIILKLHS